jgi:S1-C subfamily serine protease
MPARLRFTTGSWAGREVRLREPEAKIGRDGGADLVIPPEDQRFVSREHAVIVKDGGRYLVQDLGSSNGSWVNGVRVQSAALADGDEIQFGRQGPVARFHCDRRVETVLDVPEHAHAAVAGDVGRRPAATPGAQQRVMPPLQQESPSRLVRRLVNEAVATTDRRSRNRVAVVAAILAVVGGGAVWAMFRSGVLNWDERTFRRLAEEYQSRVALVEVGVVYNGRYTLIGNGSGFVASDDGYIVTNKHVVYTHLFDEGVACLAESFARRGIAFERRLMITVWPGGSPFSRAANSASGDRGLGYSTEQKTLSLAAVATNNLLPAVNVRCSDAFGGPDFVYRWQRHAMDNNDLAVLHSTKSLAAIPLADTEPDTDDPVMVYGFPTGTVPLETNKAEPIRRVGHVLRTRETIQIDAVVLHGNSGGPLIDRNGKVVGITTRGTAESLNMAIKVEYAKQLIDRARALGR